jgi:anaerobic magnesium-protoporphyrin IX monomethyl ester cyclase
MKRQGRVLFVNPNLIGMKDGLNRIQPPLGPMIMASAIRKRGYDVRIHDAALEGWDRKVDLGNNKIIIGQTDNELGETIGEYDPDFVAISALFSNLMESAHTIARIAKSTSPNATVVLGGNHISNAISDYLYATNASGSGMTPELIDLEDPNIDYAMRGEVDFEFPNLIDSLYHGKDVANLPGLVTKINKPGNSLEYLINQPPAKSELSSLPHPARDLANMEKYFQIGAFHSAKSRSKRVLSVMASRGCPEHCTFCTTPEMWGSRVRWRTNDDLMEEINKGVDNYNIGEIQFEDDTITARKKNLLELCKGLEKVGLPWCTPNGTKTNYHMSTQPGLYKAMADSGCYQITLACESGVQRVLDEIIGKNLKVDQMMPAIENAKNAGMLVHTFWILGYPGETYDEMQQTINFAEQSGADSYSFAILSPLPGTAIYRDVVKNDLWWPGRGLKDLMYRSSLVKVDGFSNPDEFEDFVNSANKRLNRQLSSKDPERFKTIYGDNENDDRYMVRQT